MPADSLDPTDSIQDLHEIDRICQQFESSWQSGQQPSIEQYVDNVDESLRKNLLRELLLLELDYRSRKGEPLSEEEYQARFPQDSQLVSEVFEAGGRANVHRFNESFLEKLQASGPVDIEKLIREHPEHEERIRQLLPAMEVLAGLKSSALRDESDSPADGSARSERTLGDYRILREIARGGMGVVYEAEQISLARPVALKVLPLAAVLDSRQLQRFRREAQAAAALHHQNIVPVHGVGCERGVHYYAMQYIEGQPLSKVIRDLQRADRVPKEEDDARTATDRRLADSLACGQIESRAMPNDREAITADLSPSSAKTTRGDKSDVPHDADRRAHALLSTKPSIKSAVYFRTVAELGIQVAGALDYAHQEGVVHRDIKPSNLILDAQGKLWVTDFGLARVENHPEITITGDLVGTLRYMSPEQVLAKRVIVDHRTDIYSLGLTLYELLTLRPAFPSNDRHELLRQIAFEEPRLPRQANRAVPVELETVVLKATARNPAERYATALELAEDLQRFLEDKPVTARRPSLTQRFVKWSRRHKQVVVFALALLLIAAVVGPVVATREASLRKSAEAEKGNAEDALLEAEAAKRREEVQRKRAEAERDAKQSALMRSEGLRLSAQSLLTLPNNPGLALVLAVEGAQRHQSPVTSRSLLAALDANYEHKTLIGHSSSITIASFSPDGSKVLTAQGARGSMPARVWDVATGRQLATLKGEKPIQWAIFSPDGGRILTTEMDSMVRVWDAATATELFALRVSGYRVGSSTFSSDGIKLVLPSQDNSARVFDASSGKELLAFSGHEGLVAFAGFSPDDQRVLTYSQDQTVRIWDANTGRQLIKLDWLVGRHKSYARSSTGEPLSEQIESASFSRDGRFVLTTSTDFTGRIWDAQMGTEVHTLPYLSGRAELSPDGQRVMHFTSGDQFALVRIRDVKTGETLLKLEGHERGITSATYSPDGRRVVTASYDKTVRIWDAYSGEQLAVLKGHEERVRTATFSPDGQYVVSGSDDGTARIWNSISGREMSTLPLPKESPQVVAVSPDGQRLTALRPTDLVTSIWNVETGQEISLPIRSLGGTISPDGSRILTSNGHIFEVATGKPLVSLIGRSNRIGVARFSADGKYVVTGSTDHTVRVWESATGKELAVLSGHTDRVADTAFSPDGKLVISASADRSARIWQWETGKQTAILTGHGDRVTYVAFGPRGESALTVGHDRTARVWDVASGMAITTLRDPIGITAAAISADGARVLTYESFTNPVVRIWELQTGKPILELKHDGPVAAASFSPDGTQVFVAAEDQTARIWNATTGKEVVRLKRASGIRHAAFRSDGKQIVGASGYSVQLWDATSGEHLKVIAAHSGGLDSVEFSPTGTHILASSIRFGATIWDVTTRQKAVDLQGGHGWQIWHMAFSPDGTKLVTASYDTTARVWDTATGKLLAVLTGHEGRLQFAEFSPDGTMIVTTADDGNARIWDATTGEALHTLAGHDAEVSFASFDRDSKRLLTASKDTTARVWDVETGEELVRLKHGSSISIAQFSPDGRMIFTASSGWIPAKQIVGGQRIGNGIRRVDERSARIWDANTGEQLHSLEHDRGVSSAAFSPDGRELVTVSGTVHIWDALTGQKRVTLEGPKGSIRKVAINPEGDRLIASVSGGDVHLWDVSSGKRLVEFTIEGGANRVSFTPDGKSVISVARDGSVRFYPVDPLAAAVKRAPRQPTMAERERYEVDDLNQ